MLSIKALSHTYENGVKAINNVNLTIPKGMFGLLGPNGAGKSSLMRTLATLQQPTTGQIAFEGVDILQSPDDLRRQLGYLPQDFGVYPRGSAYDLLNHLAILKGLTDKKARHQAVERLLVQTNLFEVRKKNVSTFSGGMKQRFGIAQALLGKPKLIIVDEPTAGLDPQERNRFHNLLADIGEDIVVILSTHIVEDVADLCTNMAVLAKGEISIHGKPKELIRALENHIWTKTIHKTQLSEHQQAFNVISDHLCSGQVEIRVHANAKPEDTFVKGTPTLEDVYFIAINKETCDD